jgi:hypothetical protein
MDNFDNYKHQFSELQEFYSNNVIIEEQDDFYKQFNN